MYKELLNLLYFFKGIDKVYSLKYERFKTLGCKGLGIRRSELVAKTQFLNNVLNQKERND